MRTPPATIRVAIRAGRIGLEKLLEYDFLYDQFFHTVKLPISNVMIIGHQKIRERLLRSVEKQTASQSYIFVGPESVGKFEVAKEFALQLMHGHSKRSKDVQNKDVDIQKEIDLLILQPEQIIEKGVMKEKDITIEQVRESIRFLESFPYMANKKVLIIRDAHRLTESAQNAFLKILEEPPVFAVIILITHELGKILPTMLSRCQQVSFQLVSSQEISDGMRAHALHDMLSEQYTFLFALGRPGLMIQSVEQEKVFKNKLIFLEQLTHLLEKPLRDRLVLSELFLANMNQTLQILMWWTGGLHAKVLASPTHESVRYVRSIEKVEKLRSDLKRFPSSARLIMDTFFMHW